MLIKINMKLTQRVYKAQTMCFKFLENTKKEKYLRAKSFITEQHEVEIVNYEKPWKIGYSHAIARSRGMLGEPGGLLGLDGFRTFPRSNAVC